MARWSATLAALWCGTLLVLLCAGRGAEAGGKGAIVEKDVGSCALLNITRLYQAAGVYDLLPGDCRTALRTGGDVLYVDGSDINKVKVENKNKLMVKCHFQFPPQLFDKSCPMLDQAVLFRNYICLSGIGQPSAGGAAVPSTISSAHVSASGRVDITCLGDLPTRRRRMLQV
ncbi:hypothetical protein WJX72_001938 [[Myrmecia] bisecta]|uniref:Uncharacterized protein n=1 Tax=[Myrmecia] bisecta TaxID=41462 RepID=A0AAW1PK09_9CHLO